MKWRSSCGTPAVPGLPVYCGYGTQTATWIRQLAEMGHEVTVSSYWGISGAPTEWHGITVLPGWGKDYCTPSLYQHAKMINPDLIITLGDIWVMDPNLLRELPLAHWLPVDCRPQSLADRGCIDASGAQLIAMSKWGHDRMRSAGYDPVYVPHGIDTDIFKPGNRNTLRETCGISEDTFIIGMNAANNDAIRKGIPEAMLAFARFREAHPDTVLTLHTGAHTEGGQDLEAVAENLGISDSVMIVDQYRYTAGLITAPDLAEWYSVLDVLLAASYGEGFGLPILEAQACGVPVITADSSAMTELNPHGLSVGGEPFWNGVHRGWWTRPSIAQLTMALEKAHASREETDRDKLREFALRYDVNIVRDEFMKPAVEELLARMEKRRGAIPALFFWSL